MRSLLLFRFWFPALLCTCIGTAMPGCATSPANPAAYGHPPAAGSVEALVRAHMLAKWSDRAPENIRCSPAQKAHHAKLTGLGEKVIWQGYAVPVAADINTATGRRVLGRRYAAMFSGNQLVGMVDYPGTVNAKGVLGFYWDDSSPPPVARQVTPPDQASPVLASVETATASAASAPLRIAPVASPQASSSALQKIQGPPPQEVQEKPVPTASGWARLGQVPALGTSLFLASDKSYVGVVAEYEDLHAFANNTVAPAVCVRYASGDIDWFSMAVASRIYVVESAKPGAR